MNDSAKYLNRVKQSAEGLAGQLQQKTNVPLDTYVDTVSLQAVTDAMSIDPSSVTHADLARIHMIRDGIHDALQKANEDQDDASHSIEQLLNGLSRLYVDVERLVQQNDEQAQSAKSLVNELMATSRHSVSSEITRQVTEQANAIIGNVQITQRIINLKILNFEFGEFNLFKEFRMNVKRLSASVFAIKLGFDKGIVFEGTIRFLNEGVDRIISDIAKFSKLVAEKYASVKDFLESLAPLVEKGTRFVRFIGNVIKELFEDEQMETKEISFAMQSRQKSPVLLSASRVSNGDVVFGGRRGTTILFNKRTGQFLKQPAAVTDDVHAIGLLTESRGLIVGTQEGLNWVQSIERNRNVLRARFSERVSAVAIADWASAEIAVISGAKNGFVRRWSLAGGLSAYKHQGSGETSSVKLGRSIQRILIWKERVVVASDEAIWVLDQDLVVQAEVPINLSVMDMALLPNDRLAVVGKGLLGEINLSRGAYQRMLTVTPTTEYVAVAHLQGNIVVAGTSNGKVRALDMNSGAEVGEISTEIGLKGLIVQGNTVFAFGGSWSKEMTSIAKLLWKETE